MDSRIHQVQELFYIPGISTKLTLSDYIGSIKVHFNIGRMKYEIDSGIYAVNNPDRDSPVFVSGNYKLSFDHLRKNLKDMSCWILVLDIKGINVWCAAGNGTFGTEELVRRIEETGLEEIVSHRKVVVPQLGAVGVSAHQINKLSGFNVLYGPVRASDIPEFLERGMKTTDEMRKVRFNFIDRLVLTPVEILIYLKYFLIVLIAFYWLSGISKIGFSFSDVNNLQKG